MPFPLPLDESNVKSFWQSHASQELLQLFQSMSRTETWVLDGSAQVAAKLIEFGRELGGASTMQLRGKRKELLELLAYVVSHKAMRLVAWMEANHRGLMQECICIAMQEPQWDAGQVFLDRLRSLKTHDLMQEIFHPTNVSLIERLIDEDYPDEDE